MPKFSLAWFIIGIVFAMFILPFITSMVSGKAKRRTTAPA